MEGNVDFKDARKLECWACDNCKVYSPRRLVCVCSGMKQECFEKLCED